MHIWYFCRTNSHRKNFWVWTSLILLKYMPGGFLGVLPHGAAGPAAGSWGLWCLGSSSHCLTVYGSSLTPWTAGLSEARAAPYSLWIPEVRTEPAVENKCWVKIYRMNCTFPVSVSYLFVIFSYKLILVNSIKNMKVCLFYYWIEQPCDFNMLKYVDSICWL